MADQFSAALSRTAASLTPLLQKRAAEMGWPEDVAASLTIQPDEDGNLLPSWPKDMEQRVLGLEGGTQDQDAMPVIHSFFSNPDGEKSVRNEAQAQLSTVIRDLDRRLFG